MDTLQSMRVFVRVAQRSGFAAAARDLRMSAAAVTKHVAAVEERVGARLLDRTTRSVRLTEAGQVYFERCLDCLQAVEDADNSVRQLADRPRGLLRVTAPVDSHHLLAPIVGRFMTVHPEVNIELRLSNRPMDIVDEGIDVALRIASPNLEGDLIARLLTPVTVVTVASPTYLEREGRPKRPHDLERHRTLVFVEPRPRLHWTYERAKKKVEVTLKPVMLTNNGTALLSAAAADAGITMVPTFNLGRFVADGALEVILTDWKIVPDLRLYAVYPHRRFLSPNVAHFVEALRDAFGDGKTDPFMPGIA